jgi:hypothetical protein
MGGAAKQVAIWGGQRFSWDGGLRPEDRRMGSANRRDPPLVSPSGTLDRAQARQNQGTGSNVTRQGREPERSGSIVSRTGTIVSRMGSKNRRMGVVGLPPYLRSRA